MKIAPHIIQDYDDYSIWQRIRFWYFRKKFVRKLKKLGIWDKLDSLYWGKKLK